MSLVSFDDISFHSFHWDNFSPEILAAHKRVMQHFGIDVEYTKENIPHGEWLDRVISQGTNKVIAIIEPDLIPLNLDVILQSAKYVYENDTFLGCAQTSNHIYPASHIFAAPAFFFITPSCYEKLGRPSFMPKGGRSDVAEELSYRAEELGIRYRTLYPSCFERGSAEGIWPLGSYGFFGIGTVFADSVYHLFQSRLAQNVELFVQRCDEVITNQFDTSGFISSTDFSDIGRIASLPKPKKRLYKRIGFKFVSMFFKLNGKA